MRKFFFVILLEFIILSLFSCAKESKQNAESFQKPQFRHDANLTITDPDGNLKAEFKVEIAQSESEVIRGLKHRDHMSEDQGMLFIFEQLDYQTFWMQDTYLSLDMIFIAPDGSIVYIEENTTPFSEEIIVPSRPNLYVLEVLAGTAEKFNIKEADIVKWQKLQN